MNRWKTSTATAHPPHWIPQGIAMGWRPAVALLVVVALMGQDPALQLVSGMLILLVGLASGVEFLAGALTPGRRHHAVRAVLLPTACVTGLVVGLLIHALRVDAARAEGDRIAAALARYHEATGSYPETLGDLVPGYLPQLPGPALHQLFGSSRFFYSPDRLPTEDLREGPADAHTPSPHSYQLGFPSAVMTAETRGPDGEWRSED